MEADCLHLGNRWSGGSPTQVIGSQHWFDAMPPDLLARTATCATAVPWSSWWAPLRSAADVLPVLELLQNATTPVIGLAMGAPGTCTRILAPAFPRTLLTYCAATPAAATAPGQITVDEMTDRYALHLVTPATKVYVHVTRPDDALSAQQQAEPGAELHVPLRAETPPPSAPASAKPSPSRSCDAVPAGVQRHTMMRASDPGVDGFAAAVTGADERPISAPASATPAATRNAVCIPLARQSAGK